MERKNLNRLVVLAFSFASVYTIEASNLGYFQYYLALIVSSFFVIAGCSLFRDRILWLYSALQTILICLYLGIFTHSYRIFYIMLYDANLNFSLILLSYELAIITTYGAKIVRAYMDRVIDAFRLCFYCHQINDRANQT